MAEKLAKSSVQSAKRKFERSLAENRNKRPFNAYIKSKSRVKDTIGPLKVEGKIIIDDNEMSCVLNDYFTSVFNKDVNQGPLPRSVHRNDVPALNSVIFTVSKVKKKLDNLKPGSAPGPDGLTSNFLKTYLTSWHHLCPRFLTNQ